MDRPFANQLTRGGTIRKHRPGGGQYAQTSGATSIFNYEAVYRTAPATPGLLNIRVEPLVCAYCNSPMIAIKLLAEHAGIPKISHYTFTSAQTTVPQVSEKV